MEAIGILSGLLQPAVILAVMVGVVIGILVGAVPGLNGPIGISLLLPLTFTLPPEVGLLLLGGIYMGCMYGGSITAILINVPGDVVAAPVAMEGFPMTQAGRAREALYYSIFASVIGGLIGVLVLIFFTPALAKFALQFGPAEMVFVALSGLIVVGALGGRILESAFAVLFGLFVSTIGIDLVVGADRFTFGNTELRAGISVVPVVLGLFCIAEMLTTTERSARGSRPNEDRPITKRMVLRRLFGHRLLLLKGAGFGTLVGLLPGVGATLAVFLSYAEAKRASPRPDLFGKGNPEGIVAAESANNATVGSSLVPLLALGVPGSPTTAIMAGALLVHGIVLGPSLFVNRPDFAYMFIFGMLGTVVVMGLIGTFGIRYFAYILRVRIDVVMPIVVVLALFGAYSLRNSLFDVGVAVAFGVLGVLFKRLQVPLPPIVIGVVLGPLIESNLARAMIIAQARQVPIWIYLLSSNLAIGLLVGTVVLTVMVALMRHRIARLET